MPRRSLWGRTRPSEFRRQKSEGKGRQAGLRYKGISLLKHLVALSGRQQQRGHRPLPGALPSQAPAPQSPPLTITWVRTSTDEFWGHRHLSPVQALDSDLDKPLVSAPRLYFVTWK